MTLEKRKDINSEIRRSIDKTLKESSSFFKTNFNSLQVASYKYSDNEAIEELGLDSELVHQLVEDYVIQILKSEALFLEHIEQLTIDKEKSRPLNYIPLRELAHKNLGVARNLRITDGQVFLEELMKKTDLSYLSLSVEALSRCAIRLKPKCAYEALKLISIKNTLQPKSYFIE